MGQSKSRFHVIDKGGENHGGYDQRLLMAEWCFGCDEDYAAQVLPVCEVFGDLQQELWHKGVVAQVFGGAPRVLSHDLQDESPMSGLHWLYLAMALLKTLFCEIILSQG
jgi:hypothetical protein